MNANLLCPDRESEVLQLPVEIIWRLRRSVPRLQFRLNMHRRCLL